LPGYWQSDKYFNDIKNIILEELILSDKPSDENVFLDANKINKELGWKSSIIFEQGLERTVTLYLENTTWLNNVTSGGYST
jgi:dTDP-glucose 4,6-dehydratase